MIKSVYLEDEQEEEAEDDDGTAKLNQDEIDALIKELGGG